MTAMTHAQARSGGIRWWNRELQHYPETGQRARYLGITVLATIVLYYELYVGGSVATQIIRDFHFTFTEYVFVSVISNAVGAFASLFAGLADRWGRANLVVGGVLVTGLLTLFGLPHAQTKTAWILLSAAIGLVEGVALVATPALIRDFSPQLGRGAAMGFWTLGPVLGSLVVTEVSSHTLGSHADWRFQFYVCGAVGVVVALIALVGLRELSPQLRDQLMVSIRDRALIEARAAGIDPEHALEGHWRQMLRFDVVGSALAISLYLLLYYVLVGFVVVYFATAFGYSEARANSLANWFWITNAVALVIAGFVSDRFRVRKPFMVLGALISLVGVGLFANAATRGGTSYYWFAVDFMVIAGGQGLAYVAWMAGFTETVEKHNPAATATGLAVWGWIVRAVVTVALMGLTLAVPATTALVDNGTRVQQIVATYPHQVKVLQQVDAGTLAALKAYPNEIAPQVKAVSELSGVAEGDVVKTAVLGQQYAAELATVQAVDAKTLAALAVNPKDASAGLTAVTEVASKFGISPAAALQRLQAVQKVPSADLTFLMANGQKVKDAGDSLKSLSKVPAADLDYLGTHGQDVADAQKDNPKQWQHWWWLCFVGQLVFLPFVFVMAGRWSPRKARLDAEEHERLVAQELAALADISRPHGVPAQSAASDPAPDRIQQ